ncbi:centrosomal protein of 120 kDa-like isoform X2 [Haemaphysalis longicornis]
MNKNYLIVTSILEGRHFPSRQGCDIVIEASFDSEVLSTDPVPHSCHPHFNTELAWSVNRKGLHVHKMHRTPVKLQCFAVERSSKKKERVGYVVLEIRGVQEGPRSTKWHPLLSSKYHGAKPEVHIGLHLEEDNVPEAPASSEPVRTDLGMQRVSSQLASSLGPGMDIDELTPRLNLTDGCYEIGREPTTLYVFTVTISFAANLGHLQESGAAERAASARSGPYQFVYHLLGHEVATEAFASLENPEFPPERASLHIRSSPPVLRRFFAAHPTLQVQLSSRTAVIGETEIPLGDFSASSPRFSVSVEGLFQLHPVPRNEALVNSTPPEYRPIVGLKVEISEAPATEPAIDESDGRRGHESPEHRAAPPPPVPPERREEEPSRPQRSQSREARPPTPTRRPPERRNSPDRRSPVRQRSQGREARPPTPTRRPPERSPERRSPVRQPRKQLDFSPPQKLGRAENCRPPGATAASHHHTGDPYAGQRSGADLRPSQDTAKKKQQPQVIDLTDDADEEQFRRFSLMLDIRSLEVLSTPRSRQMECYVRYHYHFLGTITPFQSQQWTVVNPGLPATILGGFNTYNFAASQKMVTAAFQQLPLTVEIFSRSENSDRLFATAEVFLGDVLRCPASTLLKDSGVVGQRRMQTTKVSVIDPRGAMIGELQVVVCLDDLGVTSLPPRMPLKEKEDARLREIAEEWKRHDLERDSVLRRKVKENKELEEKLKSRLKDVQSREEALARREAEFEQQKSDLQFLKSRLQKEAKETLRRSLEQYEHSLNTERKKVMELEIEQQKLKKQVSELEAKVEERDKMLDTLRASQTDAFSKEIKVQVELEKLHAEKVALLKEVQEALQQQERYRERCSQAEARLLDCQQQLRQAQQRGRQAQHDEVEALYQRARARFRGQDDAPPALPPSPPPPFQPALDQPDQATSFESREEVSPPKQSATPIVQTTRDEVAASQPTALPAQAEPLQSPCSPFGSPPESPLGASASSPSWMEHVRRLIEERDTLLESRVYTKKDFIIVELNRHIADTIRKYV